MEKGVSVRFLDAGHLMGSASIEITVTEGGEKKVLLFSGDVGNIDRPLIRNPQKPKRADVVVIESTYGDRLHGKRQDYLTQLTDIIGQTLDRGGNVVIPSFAVGRTQELLYLIHDIKKQNRLPYHRDFPVWVDSPLAVEATRIYSGENGDMWDYYDDETRRRLSEGEEVLRFPGLHTAVTSEESMAINSDPTPKVILSASGMCEAGRIRHHLKHNLWRPECTILFVGYQAEGSLGAPFWKARRKSNYSAKLSASTPTSSRWTASAATPTGICCSTGWGIWKPRRKKCMSITATTWYVKPLPPKSRKPWAMRPRRPISARCTT